MQFTTLLTIALPLVAALPQATPTPTPTPAELLAICEGQAGTYASSCPQCLQNCATSSAPAQCYYSVFFTINGIQANCEARGGWDCRNTAINQVCKKQ